jgi:ribosomal protein S18 acetylase RimI-like enzyme
VRLKPFHPSQASAVSSWATNRGDVNRWCGYRGTRVPVETIIGWSRASDVRAFGLHQGGELIAYGELWLDAEEKEVEIARVIVAPVQRSRGRGRLLVKALAEIAKESYPDIFMRVHPDNAAALRSYAAAGFRRVTGDQEAKWNVIQPVHYAWLTLPKARQRRGPR